MHLLGHLIDIYIYPYIHTHICTCNLTHIYNHRSRDIHWHILVWSASIVHPFIYQPAYTMRLSILVWLRLTSILIRLTIKVRHGTYIEVPYIVIMSLSERITTCKISHNFIYCTFVYAYILSAWALEFATTPLSTTSTRLKTRLGYPFPSSEYWCV